jgi:hypothetical protein
LQKNDPAVDVSRSRGIVEQAQCRRFDRTDGPPARHAAHCARAHPGDSAVYLLP